MLDKKELTEAQKLMASIAGIPADREGLGAEYPRMMYRKASHMTDHMLLGEELLIQGKYRVETVVVEDIDEEMEAAAEGWSRSPDGSDPVSEVMANAAADRARIAELEAQLAATNDGPRRGRPPKQVDDEKPLPDA